MSRASVCHLDSAEGGNVTMYSSYVYANVVPGQRGDLFLVVCYVDRLFSLFPFCVRSSDVLVDF